MVVGISFGEWRIRHWVSSVAWAAQFGPIFIGGLTPPGDQTCIAPNEL